MADYITTITDKTGTSYDIQDAGARTLISTNTSNLAALTTRVSTLEGSSGTGSGSGTGAHLTYTHLTETPSINNVALFQ